MSLDRLRLKGRIAEERKRFRADHPRALALFERAGASLLVGVPVTWMTRWAVARLFS